MNLSLLFIQRKIATSLLAIGLAVAGFLAFNTLPLSSLPSIDFLTINVTAQMPGASPENMASSITSPLEYYLGHVAGITQMTSNSTTGSARIILQFALTRNINGAAGDVQAAIDAARAKLPSNLPSLPTYRKVNPADSPILVLALTSDKFSVGKLYDYASTILAQKVSQMSGVGQVNVGGSSLPGIRVELKPYALSNYGIDLTEVATTISQANVNQPLGVIDINADSSSIIGTQDQLFQASDYESLIIKYVNNAAIRIKDVGDVLESVEDVRNGGYFNAKPGVFIVIFKEPGANIINTVDNIMATMPTLKASIPSGINLDVAVDRTQTIRVSLHDVEVTLIVAMILVVLVVYLFLNNKPAMLIPAVAVPLSILGTFCIMQFLGFSLNNISFMALIISTGFVVDDAVVVLENIMRHMEKGVTTLNAAISGAAEVCFTVVSMSISLIAVFIPILLMGGLVGRLFREFAVTLSVAILVSMVVSLTVTPMMCAIFLKSGVKEQTSKILWFFDKMRDYYAKSLHWSLERSKLMIFITIMVFVLNIVLCIVVPKGFFPQQDTGQINGVIQIDQSLSFQGLHKKLREIINIIKTNPAIDNALGIVGGPNNSTPGTLYINLKPLDQRKKSVYVILDELRADLAKVTGASAYLQATQDLVVGARTSNGQFQYTLLGSDIDSLNYWSQKIQAAIKTIPGIIDVSSDAQNQGLQMMVTIDYDTAARLGITPSQIDKVLYDAFGQAQVSTMYKAMNQYHVVMEVAPKYWQNPETLNQIYIVPSSGEAVPLSAIASFKPQSALLAVNHQGTSASVTISFNLLPIMALSEAVNAVNDQAVAIGMPADINASFQGTAQAFQSSLASEPLLILAAILAVYIVLGILYESYIHPITILSTLPSAGVGALLALYLSHTDLDVIAFIGIILLVGIVKKNAIMMVDFALERIRTEGKTPKEAIYAAAVLRFRPIMMTSLAAMLGAIPLILANGLGSELRRPLGITIFGGLLLSQLITLYTTPVIYLVMAKFTRKNNHG
jgi:multidrug efflux pump